MVERFRSKALELPDPEHGFDRVDLAFGHDRCYGEEGHCMVPEERDPFDRRLPHHLEPEPEIVTVTDAIRRLAEGGKRKASVDVLACGPDGAPVRTLAFNRLRLLTYR